MHAFHEFVGEIAGLDHLCKSEPRIDAGGDNVGVNLVAITEHYADGASVLDVVLNDDPGNRGFGADFGSGLASGVGNRVRDGAGATARESPGTEGAVNLAHVVGSRNVGSARRP